MMETVELTRDCEVIAIPSGMRQVLPKGAAVRIVQTRGGNYTVSSNIHAMSPDRREKRSRAGP